LLHSQSARASPLRWQKTTLLSLRLFFTASFRLKAALPVFGLILLLPRQPPTTHP
jgi:hypothetical protein